ncbi:hypothetical protein B40-8036 [Bacteroides phage B40-8]|uniref:hypothetical protein n=1 Tax=Bacteroides phage B40-8 TaxID=99179 RepID=UPI00017FB66A|nr:hypothetical protein B40-8036 [Bacteroides phage B40-8]ACH81971.1 conserved hypothetical phage protein [Bacteroides phage B40-8]
MEEKIIDLARRSVYYGDPEGYQVGGCHYKASGMQLSEFLESNKVGFLEGNAMKYVFRHDKKNKEEDLLKAIQYIKFILKYRYGKFLVGDILLSEEEYRKLDELIEKQNTIELDTTFIRNALKTASISANKISGKKANLYVAKLREVKAEYIEGFVLSDTKKRKLFDIGLRYSATGGIYIRFDSKNGETICVKPGYYVVLNEDGRYESYSKEKFESTFQPKY